MVPNKSCRGGFKKWQCNFEQKREELGKAAKAPTLKKEALVVSLR
jgi:hypothetical protein